MIGKLVTAAMTAAMFVFFILFGTLMGTLGGWVVGWFFADTILTFFSYIFGTSAGLEMWELGASLGFIGGFLRVRVKGEGAGAGALVAAFKAWMGKRRAEAEAEFLIINPRQPAPPTKPTQPVPPVKPRQPVPPTKPTIVRG